MRSNYKKAFTLVELLVVISIIGVLSSTVFASLVGAREKAKDAKVLQTMAVINSAARNCMNSGIVLTGPAHSGTGGTAVCAGDSAILPDITDTGFKYCGPTGCGGWTSDASTGNYAISVYSGSKYLVCGSGYDASAWFSTNSEWNFTGKSGCVRKGF